MPNPRKTPPKNRLIKFSPSKVLERLTSSKFSYENWCGTLLGASMVLATRWEKPGRLRKEQPSDFYNPVFNVPMPSEREYLRLKKEFAGLLRKYLQGKDVAKITQRVERYGKFSTRSDQIRAAKYEEGFVPSAKLGYDEDTRLAGEWIGHKLTTARNLFYRMFYLAITSDASLVKLGACMTCGEIKWYPTNKGRGETCRQCYERRRDQDPVRKAMKNISREKWRKAEREYRKALRSAKDQ